MYFQTKYPLKHLNCNTIKSFLNKKVKKSKKNQQKSLILLIFIVKYLCLIFKFRENKDAS